MFRLYKWAFEARPVAALFVLGSGNLILADLAAVLRRELSGLSQASGRLRKRLLEDGRLAGQVKKVSMRLKFPCVKPAPPSPRTESKPATGC
jgi:hypothetical protein